MHPRTSPGSGLWKEFSGSLSAKKVEALARERQLKFLHTSKPVKAETWDLLNEKLFAARPDVTLQISGTSSATCDLSFLRQLPNLRSFSVNYHSKVRGIEEVACLRNLESLAVWVYSLESFDFLDAVPHRKLRSLRLGATKSRKPKLSSLLKFDRLCDLVLDGQQNDIEVISQLPQLEELVLRSVTVGGLEFLKKLKHLWLLRVVLGGISNLAALKGMNSIKSLELLRVRGVKDIAVISTLIGLQYMGLQDLPRVLAIPDLSQLRSLRRVLLENMKGLKNVSSLAKAPALEEFIYNKARGKEPDHFADLLKSKSLKKIWVGFGSQKKNDALADLAAQAGIKPSKFPHGGFKFR